MRRSSLALQISIHRSRRDRGEQELIATFFARSSWRERGRLQTASCATCRVHHLTKPNMTNTERVSDVRMC